MTRRAACFFWALIGAAALAIAQGGCNRENKGAPAPEAPKVKSEGDLAYLKMSAKQFVELNKHGQIKTEPVRTELVQEHAEYTGWIAVPQGHEVTLTAPVSGYVRKAPKEKFGLVAGHKVKADQELFALDVVLTPIEEVQMAALKRDVASELAKAQISMAVAQKELDRTLDLKKQGLRGQQEVDKAQERVDQARETVQTAQDKQKLFVAFQAVPVKSPLTGTVLTVHANPGEFVAKSAPLVTIADLSKLWVRVPIPENELANVKPDQTVTINPRGNGHASAKAGAQKPGYLGKPVALLPQVDLQRHTVDLIYELVPRAAGNDDEPAEPGQKSSGKKQPDGKALPFAKDQMVRVLVPLGDRKKETVVPYEAVVYDSQGGAWVYVDLSNKDREKEGHRFQRQRVDLGPVIDGSVVIRPALPDNTVVVSRGAALLFSREFHSAPGAAADIDDDD